MPSSSAPEVPIFNPRVATAAQDIADWTRLVPHASGLPRSARTDRVGRNAAASLLAWTRSIGECLAKIKEARGVASGSLLGRRSGADAALLDEVCGKLIEVEDMLAAAFDAHAAAVWLSIPAEDRIRRFARYLRSLEHARDMLDHATNAADHTRALTRWLGIHELVDERARLDPTSASAAGHDPLRHDDEPIRWEEAFEPGAVAHTLHP